MAGLVKAARSFLPPSLRNVSRAVTQNAARPFYIFRIFDAALLAAGAEKSQLLIEKHRYRGPDDRNTTVSIARISECAQ